MSTDDITDPIANQLASIRYSRSRYGASDAALEFRRRRGPDKVIEPTERDWALYRAADAALKACLESDFIYVDGWVDEPHSHREPGDYIETEDEYRQRAYALAAERGFPDDLGRALSIGEWRILTDAPYPEAGTGYRRQAGYFKGGLVGTELNEEGEA